jgi:excisionase family DNA binding protein
MKLLTDQPKAAELLLRLLDALPADTTLQLDVGTLRELLQLTGAEEIHRVAITEEQPMANVPSELFMGPQEMMAAGSGEMTVLQAGEVLGLTKQAILHHVHRGHIAARKFGKNYAISAASVVEFKRSREGKSQRRSSNGSSRATENSPNEFVDALEVVERRSLPEREKCGQDWTLSGTDIHTHVTCHE